MLHACGVNKNLSSDQTDNHIIYNFYVDLWGLTTCSTIVSYPDGFLYDWVRDEWSTLPPGHEVPRALRMKRLELDEVPEDEDAQLRAARIGVISNLAVFAAIILLMKAGEDACIV